MKPKRRLVAEMNVVPYIDVMLVLLVIFMVTAPLLTQGVSVDLPKANAQPVVVEDNNAPDPMVASINANGELYLSVGENPNEPISPETLLARAAAVLRLQPKTPVMVKGDRNVDYGAVMQAMVLLQQAGAPKVGLITDAPSARDNSNDE